MEDDNILINKALKTYNSVKKSQKKYIQSHPKKMMEIRLNAKLKKINRNINKDKIKEFIELKYNYKQKKKNLDNINDVNDIIEIVKKIQILYEEIYGKKKFIRVLNDLIRIKNKLK